MLVVSLRESQKIFILAHAMTGSTMLRYVLDSPAR
jgi:hypothetical protein